MGPGNELWFVVTADIIRSRRLRPREQAQQHIQAALTRLNSTFSCSVAGLVTANGRGRTADSASGPTPGSSPNVEAIASPFTLGRGDELQGVLTVNAPLLPVLRHLRGWLQPVQLRIGVGLGSIETPMNSSGSWQMDGAAFRLSRQALERLGHSTLPRTLVAIAGAAPPTTAAAAAGGGSHRSLSPHDLSAKADIRAPSRRSTAADRLQRRLNVLLALTDELMRRWTSAQWEAVAAVEQSATYREAAQLLGITPQNVHKRIRAAGWLAVTQAEILARLETARFLALSRDSR